MIQTDPYTPDEGSYECVACCWRATGVDDRRSCPECGGFVRNIAVPRK